MYTNSESKYTENYTGEASGSGAGSDSRGPWSLAELRE